MNFPRYSVIGFNELFNQLERQLQVESGPKYPPHDIVKISDTKYEIRLAVAGFSKDAIEVSLESKSLVIKGAKIKKVGDAEPEVEFLYNGISNRSFERSFVLNDNIQVTDVSMIDGILTVQMEEVVPDAKKPRVLSIK